MNTITVSASKRDQFGKTGVKAVRAEGKIPGIIYGNDAPTPISVTPRDVRGLIYTPDFFLAEVDVEGDKQTCILKDYDCHPVTEQIMHLDFLRLKEGVTVKVDVPVKFEGVSPGVKVGGKLIQQMRKITLKTTPEHLVSEVVVNISHLELNGVLRVRDIVIGDEVKVMANPTNPLATVEVPRALKSAEAAAEKEGAAEGDAAATEETAAE